MRIFCLKTCDTCRKAIKALRAAGHDPQIVDVRDDGLDPGDLDRIVAEFGMACVNTRSTTWRGLSEDDRNAPPQELIARHPTVMKRPVIDIDGALYLGWTAQVQAAVL